MKFIVAVALLCTVAVHSAAAMGLPNPIHASCNLDWNVGVSCKSAGETIVDQIKAWSGTNCGSGQKCRYTLDSFDGTTLKAKHTTPVKHYVDDLTMTFTTNKSDCAIHGHSTSEVWYAVLDYGTNYCNLHNLITGSGLNNSTRFAEKTSDSECTQYSSADCEKY